MVVVRGQILGLLAAQHPWSLSHQVFDVLGLVNEPFVTEL